MTRQKKSRKPGLAPASASKDKKDLATPSDKKPKKLKGRKPGSRQTDAIKKSKQKSAPQTNKDPRVGSKKPIMLTKAQAPEAANKAVKAKPAQRKVAAIKVLDNTQALEQEFYAIEEDAQLQSIFAKQEQEQPLTNEEIDYFNEKMERYHNLQQQLGWSDEEESSEPTGETDEDALWDKLDNNHLSDYE
ncbi:Der GTPase-activating protein YihI [Thalassotalea insulae]|uniref:Der GTPase-activating protein YihI n=1 Tax=Thalassotalea insulae TaxID=2056778 RepID=A0ABQ6GVF6_9GAMM|nr:Der GTPase-activating protein YihI [Thalassotalea insulae]GLX78665.1 Der GTPase-activating protein YihI [Thalassotalea insulae]